MSDVIEPVEGLSGQTADLSTPAGVALYNQWITWWNLQNPTTPAPLLTGVPGGIARISPQQDLRVSTYYPSYDAWVTDGYPSTLYYDMPRGYSVNGDTVYDSENNRVGALVNTATVQWNDVYPSTIVPSNWTGGTGGAATTPTATPSKPTTQTATQAATSTTPIPTTGGATTPVSATTPPVTTTPSTNLLGGLQGASTGTYGDLPTLLRPSAQYNARMGPTAQQQWWGYEQARTGAIPEETQFRQWSMAPPSGPPTSMQYRR